ncbi:MAG: DNA repair protein [Clostridia bacterium]|nr:DNA repair protein [Clostridia bacterium]
MTEKELKKLNRKQLLELLLVQTSRADRLEAELAEANKMLKRRELLETEAGTMAEAALKINGVFEAVDAAAAQYLQNIMRINKFLEEKAGTAMQTADQTSDEQNG